MEHDYSAFAEEVNATNILAAISSLASDQKAAEAAVAAAEEALEKAKAALREIAEHRLPELMDAAQMTEFTTRDGIKISVKETIRASLPKGREAEAFEWLREHEHEGLIKNEFKVPLNREQAESAVQLAEALQGLGLEYEQRRTIHPSTLASFVKEQLEAGVELPMDAFGVYRNRATKITIKQAGPF
jgi:hypothetical protein